MSDYTYIRPTDPAATEAELTEAMHLQAAPVWVDMEYTYDAPPVRLVRASEVAELRARLDAATQRAEAAEADLASLRAQLDPIRQHLATLDAVRRKLDEDYNNANRNGLLLLLDCIRTLAQQDEGEVQP